MLIVLYRFWQIGNERCRSPEILFNPLLIGLEYPGNQFNPILTWRSIPLWRSFSGIHDLLVNSIARADLDLRKTLYSQIVLSGGSTFFSGFGDRLLNEVRKMAPKDTKVLLSQFLNQYSFLSSIIFLRFESLLLQNVKH